MEEGRKIPVPDPDVDPHGQQPGESKLTNHLLLTTSGGARGAHLGGGAEESKEHEQRERTVLG